MSDPSVVGAANALAEQLRSIFPTVPYETICEITAQHASDPHKCLDLVRLESSRPASINESPSSTALNYSNGGLREGSSEPPPPQQHHQQQHYYIPASLVRPRGSYVIRRSQDSPGLQAGAATRDTRSCTPPRVPQPVGQQHAAIMNPTMPNNAGGQVTRPLTLDVHSVLQHRSPSPVGQSRMQFVNPEYAANAAQSCPGTPTGGASATPRTSMGFAGNLPSLKINYQNGSQIIMSPSNAPNSPTVVVSSQPGMGGGKPIFYQFASRQAPSQTSSGLGGGGGAMAYVRRPSYAEMELTHRSAASPQSSLSSSTSGLHRDALRVSAENLTITSDGGYFSSSISPGGGGGSSSTQSSSVRSSSPNIRISLDSRGGGAIISSSSGGGDSGVSSPTPTSGAARIRPRVTFTPMMVGNHQSNCHPLARSTAAFTVTLRQPSPHSPVYDSSTLVRTAAITNAQAEECLKQVLAHQRARLADMKKAMAMAKQRLQELRMDVESMEQDLTRHRKHSVRSAAISDETMTSLHRETRELQAEIQTMLKEMEIHRHTAGERKVAIVGESNPCVDGPSQLTLPLRPQNLASGKTDGVDGIESEQWSCSVCTFSNHIDLPSCECCEMPRLTDVDVDGWQLVYDLSPSAHE